MWGVPEFGGSPVAVGVIPGGVDLLPLRVLKGSVQQDVTGINIGLKISVLKSNITGMMSF